jgi:signal transduction histidine kinase
MEGSPVRGQERPRYIRLSEARDIQSFQAELVRQITAALQNTEVICGFIPIGSTHLQLPSWIKSHLDKHPALYQKLRQGELVGITHAGENSAPRPASAVRSSILLIPVLNDAELYGVIGLVSAMEGPQLSHEQVEQVRQFAHDTAPIVARLYEVERLRRQTAELLAVAHRTTTAEADLLQLVQEKDRLMGILQMRSHFQANIAHEIRTPLAAIRGYARMLLDGRAGEINDTQKEYLRVVTDNTNRLINIVGWMTHVTDFGGRQMDLTDFDLRDLWTECLEANTSALAEKSITLASQIPNEPFVITGDRQKLLDVFNHLIAAAIAFTPDGGKVVADFSHGREQEVMVKISDNGSGIPQEILSKISDRSFSPIPSASKIVDACAADLADVYDVIGIHGGRIFVSSKPGEGSSFMFSLPAVTLDGEEKVGHEQAVNSSRRRR